MMNRCLYRVVALLIISLFPLLTVRAEEAAQEPTIKVGSYNLCTSDSRKSFVEQGKKGIFADPQRYWSKSAPAVADMIVALDCDVLGMQEICDSIWGVKGNADIRRLVAERSDDFGWILYPNTLKGISYDVAIAWKKSVCDTLQTGIFWTGGIPDQPKTREGEPKHVCRPCVWARLRHKASGKEFWFFSAHTVTPQRYKDDKWPRNRGNNLNLMEIRDIASRLVPEEDPSIVVGDLNVAHDAKDWRFMANSRWLDVLVYAKDAGWLSDDAQEWGTQNSKDESEYSKWYPDHIMVNGFRPLTYTIDRRRFRTEDGSLHYPSDHLPITADVKFLSFGKPIAHPTPSRDAGKAGARVVSFNIRYFNNQEDRANGWDHRKWAVLAMLRDVKPDIMGVQESMPRQNEFIQSRWEGYEYVATSRNGNGTGEFASTFYNTKTVELEKWGYFWLNEQNPSLPVKGWDAAYLRMASWCVFKMKDSGKRLFFVNTHLDNEGKNARVKGLELILSQVGELNTEHLPLVIAGDFNAAPKDKCFKEIRKVMKSSRETALSSDKRPSFNDFGQSRGSILDYIWYGGFQECCDFKVIAEPYEEAPFVSDHYPIRADLVF